jgi:hypothetical protein
VTSICMEKEWPLRFRRFLDNRRGVSAMSVGKGWARFMSDHGLGIGALLTFEVVDERRLVVGVHRRSALKEPQSFQQHPNLGHLACDSREQPEVGFSFPAKSRRPRLHEDGGDACPHFLKTLRKTHTKKCTSARMVSWFYSSFPFWQKFVSYSFFWCVHLRAGGQFGEGIVAIMYANLIGMGAGCPSCVLAQTRTGGVRGNLVHSQRAAVAMDGEDCDVHFREADFLLLHSGLGGLLHRKPTQARRHVVVHTDWNSRV